MSILKPKQILIAPLDWGLGHTARCIPIIRYIKSLGHVPIVAGNVSQESFIKGTFGSIDFIRLPGYNITYSKWNRLGQAGLLSQLPGIYQTIRNEHNWLLETAQQMQIDGIISDNRYGIFHPDIPSVIMTHQLQVQSGMGGIVDYTIQKVHYTFLERFRNIWVVDDAGADNLAGKLSHPEILPRGTKYIGLLSRFGEREKNNSSSESLLVLLSGPEPQRSVLSAILWHQVQQYNGKVIFIEGSEAAIPPTFVPAHITYLKRITGDQLEPLLSEACMVICRSGYSTLMDLAALPKKAIIIPTPGQTEQKYLARYLSAQNIFYTAKQNGFNLEKILRNAQQFPFHFPDLGQSYRVYKEVVKEWVAGL